MKHVVIVVLIGCFFVSLGNIASRNLDQTETPTLIPVKELSKRDQVLVRDYVLQRVKAIEI